ncbi:MAG: PilZ domain-containing protein [Spirochaetia bacterium]
MKILLIAEREMLRDYINLHFRPHGSEIIQYWNPIKAMDNLEEVSPDLVLFSAQDYPRHWKPFLTFLRNEISKNETVFILLKGDNLTLEEASKANHLGVNGIVHENLDDAEELIRLKKLVERYKDIAEDRRSDRIVPTKVDRITFSYFRVDDLTLVTGTVRDISSGGVSFEPIDPAATTGMETGRLFRGCTLRVGEKLLSIDCKLVKNNRQQHFMFSNLSKDDLDDIKSYLEQHTIRQIISLSGKADQENEGINELPHDTGNEAELSEDDEAEAVEELEDEDIEELEGPEEVETNA